MAIVKVSTGTKGRGNLNKYTQASGANAAQTCSTDGGQVEKLLYVLTSYSATPTQTGVTITVNSNTDAAYDTLLNTASANVRYNLYNPTDDIIIRKGDALDVTAPAGGAGITSAISIYTEAL